MKTWGQMTDDTRVMTHAEMLQVLQRAVPLTHEERTAMLIRCRRDLQRLGLAYIEV